MTVYIYKEGVMKKVSAFVILALILSISSAYALTGYTNISSIALYKDTDYSAGINDTLKISSKLHILNENQDWYHVKTANGKTGWIEKYFVTVPSQRFVVNNTINHINIRTSATTSAKVVGQLAPGEKIRYVDTYHSWHIVEFNGDEYYIASWLTDIEYDASQEIILLYDTINIRDSASTNGKVITQGNKNDIYKVTGEKNGWLQTKLTDGKTGYVAGWLTSYNSNYFSEGNQGHRRTTDELNLRTGPSVNNKKITALKKGETVIVIESVDGWSKVVSGKGMVGWVNAYYLKDVYPLAGKTILLDPGHGGKDPGAISFSGKFEKHVNLEVANKLKNVLETLGAKVHMTRSNDTYIANKERGKMADRLNVDMFLSIHHNSLNNRDYFGLSTYYNTINYKSPSQGYNLAEAIYLNAITINGVYRDGILDRNYEVLRETKRPAALIEIGFMSNPQEEMNIHNLSFQNVMVDKIADGIVDYLLQ